MKRSIAMILALLMVMTLVLTGCGGGQAAPAAEAPAAEAPADAPAAEAPAEEAPAAEEGAEPAAAETAAEPGEPVYGGDATFYYSDFNTVFDPAMGEQYTYSLWLEYLFTMDWGANEEGLFRNNSFTIDTAQGQIADSWEWDPETCDFTVTIRDDIYFQQKDGDYDIFGGRNLTADDVKYSYDRVMGTGSGFDESNYVVIDADWRTRLYGYFDSNYSASGEPSGENSGEPAEEEAPAEAPDRDYIEVTGPYTVVFHMGSPSEVALSEFVIAQVNITGPEWDTLTDEQKLDWHYACGTGPYILTDYVADNHYTFAKNENYYDYDERYPENKLPYLDTITLQKYGDSTSVLSDFFAGKLDFVSQNAKLTDSEVAQLTGNADVQKYDYPYQAAGLGLKCNQEPFSDIRVRIAMQKAINLEEVATAYYGYDSLEYPGLWDMGQAGWSAVPDWDAELLDEYTYDPEAAKALLAEAGYPDGFSFTVAIDLIADPDLFELAKGYLAAVGINMEIEKLADMSEGRQVQGNPDDPRQFNMNLASGSDAGFAYQTYATDGFAYCFYNYDTEFDDLLAATRDALTPADQVESAHAADLHFSQSHIIIALSGPTESSEFFSSRIGGMQNGELLSAYHFFKTIPARLWVNG